MLQYFLYNVEMFLTKLSNASPLLGHCLEFLIIHKKASIKLELKNY